jgi:CRP-like cAMP-binding protein
MAKSVPTSDNNLLAALPAELSRGLFAKARTSSLAAGQMLFLAGDEGDGCYRVGGAAQANIVAPAGASDFAVLTRSIGRAVHDRRRAASASVSALRDSKLSFISRAAFVIRPVDPQLYRHVDLLARRLRDTNDALTATSFLGEGTVARALLSLAERSGRTCLGAFSCAAQ